MSETQTIQRMLRAAAEGDLAAVRHFLETGVPADARDRHGNRALNHAAKAGRAEVVALLLRHGANANEADGVGRTPLMACAEGDHANLVDALIAAGADVNGKGGDGRTALMECANHSSADVARRLIQRGADVNMQRDDGSTALHEAVFSACEVFQEPTDNQIMPLLLAAGANIHCADGNGITPLALARRYANQIDYTDVLARHSKQD